MLRLGGLFGAFFRFQGRTCLQTGVCPSFTTPARQIETIDVPVGGNGTVRLDVEHRALKTSEYRPSVLINFSPGPSFFQLATNNAFSETFRSSLSRNLPSTTFITLNYRLSKPSLSEESIGAEIIRFPQPIHDATIAFAHILDDIIPLLFDVPAASSPSWKPDSGPRVALAGSHIGAGLATMLALTNPNSIHAVALADPMVDWVILDELLRIDTMPPPTSRGKRSVTATPPENMKAVSLAAKRLIDIRTKVFASPSAYFDPFASPTLFLRAPGRDTPRTHAEVLGLLDEEGGLAENTDDYEWDVSGRQDSYWDGVNVDDKTVSGDSQTLNDFGQASPTFETRADQDTLTEAIGTDSFGPYDDDHSPPSSPASTASLFDSASSPTSSLPDAASAASDSSSTRPISKQVKRRKVLRRWPPSTDPETVMLPYFNVFVSAPHSPSTPESFDIAHGEGMQALLRIQGMELVDLLRRACFYGREKGVGEERVRVEEYEAGRGIGGDGRGRNGGAGEMREEGLRSMINALKRRLEEA